MELYAFSNLINETIMQFEKTENKIIILYNNKNKTYEYKTIELLINQSIRYISYTGSEFIIMTKPQN